MGGHHVARGTTNTKQTAKRWAAMRLLKELNHVIDPAFFRDTPEGQLCVQGQLLCEASSSTQYHVHLACRRTVRFDSVTSPCMHSLVVLAASATCVLLHILRHTHILHTYTHRHVLQTQKVQTVLCFCLKCSTPVDIYCTPEVAALHHVMLKSSK